MAKQFVSFQQAQKIIGQSVKTLQNQKVDLMDSFNRILAKDVISPLELPPSDNSAMDGFAVRYQDIKEADSKKPVKLKVIGSIFAGQARGLVVRRNQAIRIMTGAPIPKGVDTVVPVEETREKDNYVFILRYFEKGANVRYTGEDIRKGEKVLEKGKLIRPGEIALLAALGYSKVKVIKPPQVAILATGDELVDINRKLPPGKIRNSNSHSLAAAVLECNAKPVLLGIARDKPQALRVKIRQGLRACDVLIISGGISMGKSDFVGTAIKDLGVKIKFTKVLQRPGQPFTFGIFKSKPVFCLPGNPVSSLLAFEMHIRSALFKMMGRKDFARTKITACIDEEIRLKSGRTYFLRVRLKKREDKYYAYLTGPQGSGIMKSMVLVDGLLVVPDDVDLIKKGEAWPIMLL